MEISLLFLKIQTFKKFEVKNNVLEILIFVIANSVVFSSLLLKIRLLKVYGF